MNPLIKRDKIIDIKYSTDELKQLVTKYFDMIIDVVETFQSNILADQLSDITMLTANYQELISRRGHDISSIDFHRYFMKMDQFMKYIENKSELEKQRLYQNNKDSAFS